MEPICVECHSHMRCEKNGILVVHMEVGEDRKPTDDVDYVVPGDKYRCKICGREIITGFAYELTFPYNLSKPVNLSPQERMKLYIKAHGDNVLVLNLKV